jgi:hypothetical protein
VSSLIIKISQNGSSKEYLFNKLGPIIIGSDQRSDIWLDDAHIEAKLLEIKVSGGNIFIKELGARSQIYLDAVILPYREEVRYQEGECISLKDSQYQIHISRALGESSEPPPFFEGEFKERLQHMDLKIREKESELKVLAEMQDKKRNQLGDLEDRYHRHASEKNKLEIEVNGLRTQKDVLSFDMRRNKEKNEEEENKVLELREFVKRLEVEERSLKETIAAQSMVLSSLKDDREKKSKEVDQQRVLLVNLQLDTTHMQAQLQELSLEHQNQEKEIQEENSKIQRILNTSEAAIRDGVRVQNHMAQLLKERTILDHDVKSLQYEVDKLEETRKTTYNKLQELNQHIDESESRSLKIQEQIQQHQENESNLNNLNIELRSELIKAEEKLGLKKNLLNQIEFQSQDAARKLTTVTFELERASLRLKELTSEEKAQEFKMLAIRGDLQVFAKRSGEEKKIIQKSADEEKYKLGLELTALRSEIEDAKKTFSQVISDEELLQVELNELNSRYRTIAKEKQVLENQVTDLMAQKSLTEAQIQTLKSDSLKFEHERGRVQRELSQLQIKLLDCETHIKERHEEAHLELESYKREERAKMTAEKAVYLSEVEAFKQKSLIEVENEYRKKQEDLHQQKIISQESAEAIIKEARVAESQITGEANARLRQATIEAHEREIQSHNRIKEAQEYFKAKEIEADALIQKSRLESRDFLKKTEFDLLDDLSKRKAKIKKFLTMKQETGLAHIKATNDQHIARMRREEEKGRQKLEEIKRKELKKVARLRDEQLDAQKLMKEAVAKELKAEQGKALEHIHLLKKNQETELAEKKKTILEHINSTKTRQQKNWEEEIKREKELFNQSKKDRILNATQAVMNVLVSSNVGASENEQVLRDKIRSTLEMAIDGQNADAMRDVEQILDFNPMKRKKILPVIKKFSLRVGIPAAIAIVILTDAGSVRTNVVNASKKLMKQRQSASEMYVNQQKNDWKEKHTFNPETTVGYKATYTENIIYTTDFEKVMDNEEFQNDWILKVHDFMVKELELSEDMAINYISAEGTLLKELSVMKKDLHPQFLDVGIKKLTDLEKTHLGWLSEKIADPLKIERFASFRKEYYDDFYQKKFLPSRGIANEVKP